jgi:hypothetical protein
MKVTYSCIFRRVEFCNILTGEEVWHYSEVDLHEMYAAAPLQMSVLQILERQYRGCPTVSFVSHPDVNMYERLTWNEPSLEIGKPYSLL